MKYDRQIVVRVHTDLYDRIAAIAEDRREKKSRVIRRALEIGLQAMTTPITRRRRPAPLELVDINTGGEK